MPQNPLTYLPETEKTFNIYLRIFLVASFIHVLILTYLFYKNVIEFQALDEQKNWQFYGLLFSVLFIFIHVFITLKSWQLLQMHNTFCVLQNQDQQEQVWGLKYQLIVILFVYFAFDLLVEIFWKLIFNILSS